MSLLTATLLEESRYQVSPPDGKMVYYTSENAQVRTEELVKAQEVDTRIPYVLLNPLQSLFYRLYRGGSVLVASPTSSGKSLVAYLFMRNFRGRVVYVAPLKSLVNEKVKEFKDYYGVKNVALRTGDSVFESFKEVKEKVVVCTYEYLAQSLRNNAKWLKSVSAVVLDEVHQILKKWTVEEIIVACRRKGLPMLCLSATLPGVEELAKWISAELVVKSEWRPVPLHREEESLSKFEGKDVIMRLINALKRLKKKDEQVIIFVPRKEYGWRLLEVLHRHGIGIMNKTVPFDLNEELEPKVAFHNADVPKEEKDEIERAFREGKLKVLIATQTLAYGVNLPADRVIILVEFLPFKNGENRRPVPDSLDILQMEGRAGRLGIKDVGYSNILVYRASVRDLRKELNDALKKPFSTALTDQLNQDALSFLLLLAYMYEGENYMKYLKQTYSFRKLDKDQLIQLHQIETFLRKNGYIQNYQLNEKGLLCARTGIPPTKFEDFLERKNLKLDALIVVRPLLYMRTLEGFKTFLKDSQDFTTDLQTALPEPLRKQEKYSKDNTHQFLFYVKGLAVKYARIKNPPGEYAYLGTDALHLIKLLVELNKHGFYQLSPLDILQIAHSVKYGIEPAYASLAGVKGLGHIRANLIKEVLMDTDHSPPALGDNTERLLKVLEDKEIQNKLLGKFKTYRNMNDSHAKSEVAKLLNLLEKNKDGYMVDDKILYAYALFTQGPVALKKGKKVLVEEVLNGR